MKKGKPSVLLIFFCLSLCLSAQTKIDSKKLIQGKWVLESVSAHEANNTQEIDLDSLGFVVYPEMQIGQDSIALGFQNDFEQSSYQLYDESLFFYGSRMPFFVKWALFQYKLYLEWEQPIDNESRSIIILSSYKRKY